MLLYLQNVPGEVPDSGGGAAAEVPASPEAGTNNPAVAPTEGGQADPNAPAVDPALAPAQAPAETPEGEETVQDTVQNLAETIEDMGLTELFESIATDLVQAVLEFIELLKDAFPGMAESLGEFASGNTEQSPEAIQALVQAFNTEIQNSQFKSPLILSEATTTILSSLDNPSLAPLVTSLRENSIYNVAVINAQSEPSIDGLGPINLEIPTSAVAPTSLDTNQRSSILTMIERKDSLVLGDTGPDAKTLEVLFKLLNDPAITNSTGQVTVPQITELLGNFGFTPSIIDTFSNRMAFIALVINDSEIRQAIRPNQSPVAPDAPDAPVADATTASAPVGTPIPAPPAAAPSASPSIPPESILIGDELDASEIRSIMDNSNENTPMRSVEATLVEDLLIQPGEIIKFGEGATITAQPSLDTARNEAARALGQYFKDSPDPNGPETTTRLEVEGLFDNIARMPTDLYFAPNTAITIPSGIRIEGNISTWRLSS